MSDTRENALEEAARAMVVAEGGDPDAPIANNFVRDETGLITIEIVPAWKEALPLAKAAIKAYEAAMNSAKKE